VTGPASTTGANGAVVASIKVAAGDLSGIHNESIDTQGNSNSAILSIDSALDVVNAERAKMGATINRLQYAVDNLTNVSTRSSEARSRIEDTDYAQATMELAKRQIIQQAATAMLAQANQQPQQVLTLLK
jgi:flagellin